MNKTKTTTLTKKNTVKTPKKKTNEDNNLDEVLGLIKKYTFDDIISLIEKTDFDENQLKQINDNMVNFKKLQSSIDNKLDKIEAQNKKEEEEKEKQKKKEEEEIKVQKKKEEKEKFLKKANEQIKEYIDKIKDKKLKNFLKSFEMDYYDEDLYNDNDTIFPDGLGINPETYIEFNKYSLNFRLENWKKLISISFDKEYKEITHATDTYSYDNDGYSQTIHKPNEDVEDENSIKISIDTPDKEYDNLNDFCDDYKLDNDKFKKFIIFICEEIFDDEYPKDFKYDLINEEKIKTVTKKNNVKTKK